MLSRAPTPVHLDDCKPVPVKGDGCQMQVHCYFENMVFWFARQESDGWSSKKMEMRLNFGRNAAPPYF